MRGDIVYSPEGEQVVLVDIGLVKLLDNAVVRVWDVSLAPGENHPWHLHHNPYVVLSLQGSDGRMDWLDGSTPRFISEYRGGAVYRPISPVHRLTNIGDRFYQNRLVELKELGELLSEPFDIGTGARSIEGERPAPRLSDGRQPVLSHPHTAVWTIRVRAGDKIELDLAPVPHVLAVIEGPDLESDPTGGVIFHQGGPLTLINDATEDHDWFVVELLYRENLEAVLKEELT